MSDPLAQKPGDDALLSETLADEGATRGLVRLLECWARSPLLAEMALKCSDGSRVVGPQVALEAAAKTIRVLWNHTVREECEHG